MLRAVVQNARLERSFADLLSAHEVGAYRPDPRVYGLAPRRFRLDPSSVGFGSSNSFDVAGSKAFGLRAVWVNRSGAVLDPLGPGPDHTVNDLWQLAGLLARA